MLETLHSQQLQTGMPSAFISYAHDSDQHCSRVLVLADSLRSNGMDASIDAYKPHPAEGWPRWMENQFKSDYLIVVPSDRYINEYNSSVPAPSGARFEGIMLSAFLLKGGVDYSRIAIVLFEEYKNIDIPVLLFGCQRYFVERAGEEEKLLRFLTGQPAHPRPALGNVVKLPPVSARYVPDLASNFAELCQRLQPILAENGRYFFSFGPNSGASEDQKNVRFDLSLWYASRPKILENNDKMKRIIVSNLNVIPELHKPLFERWLTHIEAFRLNVELGVDYREHQFPAEVVQLIDETVSYGRDN